MRPEVMRRFSPASFTHTHSKHTPVLSVKAGSSSHCFIDDPKVREEDFISVIKGSRLLQTHIPEARPQYQRIITHMTGMLSSIHNDDGVGPRSLRL